MSTLQDCNCRCPTPAVVHIPGTDGADGSTGASGEDAFSHTVLGASLAINDLGDQATIPLDNYGWVAEGMYITIEGAGPSGGVGYFIVNEVDEDLGITVTLLEISANSAPSTIVNGKKVSQSALIMGGSIPAALTDNALGTASDTISEGVGIFEVVSYINLVNLGTTPATVLMENRPLGFKGRLLQTLFVVELPCGTANKDATITPQIRGFPLTSNGGQLVLDSDTNMAAAPTGVGVGGKINGTTITTDATNEFASGDNFRIAFSEVAGFTGTGSGWLILRFVNLDTSEAIKSLAEKFNALRTSITTPVT